MAKVKTAWELAAEVQRLADDIAAHFVKAQRAGSDSPRGVKQLAAAAKKTVRFNKALTTLAERADLLGA